LRRFIVPDVSARVENDLAKLDLVLFNGEIDVISARLLSITPRS
jgi:hypothetical protein